MDRRRFVQLLALAGLGACTSDRAVIDAVPVGGETSGVPRSDLGSTPTPSSEGTEASPGDATDQPTVEPTTDPSRDPAPSSDEPSTAAAEAAVLAVLCREAWGAQAPGEGFVEHTIRQLTIHHSAVVLGDNRNAPSRLRQHQRYHMDQGWPDIAYHLGVDRNGNVYDLRPARFRGDTFTAYDPTGHFLVLCEGDFDREQPTDAQLEAAASAFAWASRQFGVAPATLTGHRDHAPTSCPGDALYARIDQVRRRTEELARADVTRDDRCGPEAMAHVRRIESGTA